MYLGLAFVLSLLFASCSHHAHSNHHSKKDKNMQSEQLKSTVKNFYDALSNAPNDNTATNAASWMAADWNSTPTPPGGAELTGFVQTLFMFHGMIPDLKWDVQEMLVDGNRVIVRSRATGTPNSPEGYFYGVPTDGSKSFDIQTIDIHTVENGKIVRSYHCENWATAIQQVSSVKK